VIVPEQDQGAEELRAGGRQLRASKQCRQLRRQLVFGYYAGTRSGTEFGRFVRGQKRPDLGQEGV